MMIRTILLVVFFTSIVSLPTTTKDPNEIAIYAYRRGKEKVSEFRLDTETLKKNQKNSSIEIIGDLDETTLTPGSSMADESSGILANKYVVQGNWNHNELTYKIKNYPSNQIGLSENSMVDKLIALSFKDWSDVADLKFTRVSKDQDSDIELSFEPKDHGDGHPFEDDIIFHVFKPPVGLLHFNDETIWTNTTYTPDGFYLRQITTRMIGHALGLGNSGIRGSIMYPAYYRNASEYIMHQDDINGIVYLYGAKKQTSTTKVTTSKVIDDESTIFQQTTFRSVQTTTSTAVSVSMTTSTAQTFLPDPNFSTIKVTTSKVIDDESTLVQQTTLRSVQTTTSKAVSFSMTTSTAQTSLPDPNFSITEVTTSKIMDDKSTLAQPTTLRSVEKNTKLSTASIMAVVEKWILMLPTIMYFLC